MFVLRRTLRQNELSSNYFLGIEYTPIIKDRSKAERDIFHNIVSNSDFRGFESKMYGIVLHDEGANFVPLFYNSDYCMMTSEGQRFEYLKDSRKKCKK